MDEAGRAPDAGAHDYEKKWYSEAFHGNSCCEEKETGYINLESGMDRLFSYFSYICYLRKKHVISEDEFSFFRYDIECALSNKQAVSYLFNIHHHSIKEKIAPPLKYLIEYGEEKRFIDHLFTDPRADASGNKYRKYLGF